MVGKSFEAEKKQCNAERAKGGESSVDDVCQSARRLAGLHQNGDRNRVERFVQQNRQKSAETQDSPVAVHGVNLHTGGQRHSFNQRMDSQTECDPNPAQSRSRMVVTRVSQFVLKRMV